MAADVAQTRRAEQCVGNRVQQRVGIGMSEQAFFKRNVYAAENQIAAFDELVDIVTLSDTDIHVLSFFQCQVVWKMGFQRTSYLNV